MFIQHAFVVLSLVICSCLGQATDFDYDCSGLPDNFQYWWACGSYGVCRGGRYTQVDCINGTSYDRKSGQCVPNSQAVTYPCNSVPEECLNYKGPGIRYPDKHPDPVESLPPCTFYYTCAYGRYLGHQRCPEGSVYDEPQQRCLPPTQVAPPCGILDMSDEALAARTETSDGKQVIQPQTDNFGNPDTNKWPFTNNKNSRGPRQPRLSYRSSDQSSIQPQDSNQVISKSQDGKSSMKDSDVLSNKKGHFMM